MFVSFAEEEKTVSREKNAEETCLYKGQDVITEICLNNIKSNESSRWSSDTNSEKSCASDVRDKTEMESDGSWDSSDDEQDLDCQGIKMNNVSEKDVKMADISNGSFVKKEKHGGTPDKESLLQVETQNKICPLSDMKVTTQTGCKPEKPKSLQTAWSSSTEKQNKGKLSRISVAALK